MKVKAINWYKSDYSNEAYCKVDIRDENIHVTIDLESEQVEAIHDLAVKFVQDKLVQRVNKIDPTIEPCGMKLTTGKVKQD